MVDSDEIWLKGETEIDGFPVRMRMRCLLPSESDRQMFQHLVMIRWPYKGDRDELPEKEDNRLMVSFETAVEPIMERTRAGMLAASLTGRGNQEWRYYTANPEGFMKQLNNALENHPHYPVEFELFQDPDWNALSELLIDLGQSDIASEHVVRH